MERERNKDRSKAILLAKNLNPTALENSKNFPFISSDEFIDSLKSIIENPQRIHQNGHPICGVSVAIKIIAELDPIMLVKMASHFFVYGEYNPGSFLQKRIKVSDAIKSNTELNGALPAAYVLQFTIKNFLNRFSNYDPTRKSRIKGITFPWQIRRFLTDYFRIDFMNNSRFGNGFKKIKRNLEKGHRILALTSWNQMKDANANFKLTGLHYVFVRGIEKSNGKILLYVDDSSNKSTQYSVFEFNDDKELKKAVRSMYCFNKKGFKETELLGK